MSSLWGRVVAATRSGWARYGQALKERPFATKCSTAGTIFFVSDNVMQRAEGNTTWDYGRTGRMVLWVTLFHTPTVHLWFRFLDRRWPSTALPAVAGKVALDQSVMNPTLNSLFFVVTAMMEGRTLEEGVERSQERILPTWLRGVCLWAPANLFNFKFVPLDYRLLFVNSVQVGWFAYLSHIGNRPSPPTHSEENQADGDTG